MIILKEFYEEIIDNETDELWTIGRITEHINQNQFPKVRIFSSIKDLTYML